MLKKNLHKRLEALEKSRQTQYGSFEDNMENIALGWSILLKRYLVKPIPGWLIPLLYTQAKLIRATHKFKEDTYEDAVAYIVQACEMHEKESEKINTDDLLQ